MPDKARHNLAFVTPRYGPDVLGGAETLVRHTAERLAARGHVVGVYATCVTNLHDWENGRTPGDSVEAGVHVRRFPVVWGDRPLHLALTGRIAGAPPLSVAEQFEWLHSGPHSPDLYRALARSDHDLVFGAPYLFPLVNYALAVAGSRAVAWPCLHDEAHARLAPAILMLRDAHAIVFNTEPERALAHGALQLRPAREAVIGAGVDALPADAARFRAKFGIDGPFVLYAGRLEEGKNVPLLIDLFERYAAMQSKADPAGALRLVLMGEGPSSREALGVARVGFQDEQTKHDAMAAALALCQPSVNESLSFVLLEAWRHGTPALVHANCAVTTHLVAESGGGLYFGDATTFAATLDLLRTQPAFAARLGRAGRAYSEAHFAWDGVLNRLEHAIQAWAP
jgi:glycosyltransferase involved in cell wall biosynthesis